MEGQIINYFFICPCIIWFVIMQYLFTLVTYTSFDKVLKAKQIRSKTRNVIFPSFQMSLLGPNIYLASKMICVSALVAALKLSSSSGITWYSSLQPQCSPFQCHGRLQSDEGQETKQGFFLSLAPQVTFVN